MQFFTGELETRDTPPSSDEFIQEYMNKSRPVLFTRATAHWPALSRWNIDWLERQHGDVFMKSKQLSVRGWIAKMRDASAQGRIEYLSVPLTDLPGLARDFSMPRYHPFDTLLRNELWIGPGGTRTPVHCDYSENLFCQVIGRKRFQLYSPDAISSFKPALDYALYRDYLPEYTHHERNGRGDELDTLLAQDPVKPKYDFVIEPGELIYLPYGWYHRVSSLEHSWSLSSRWLTPGMLARRLPAVVLNTIRGEPQRTVKKLQAELTRSRAP